MLLRKLVYVVFVTFIIANNSYSMEQPLAPCSNSQFDELSVVHNYNNNLYVLSKGGQNLIQITLAPKVSIDAYFLNPARGETLWSEPEDEIEITASIQPVKSDYGALDKGLIEHSIEKLGYVDNFKIFVATLKNENQIQVCGVVGVMVFDNLFFHSLGTLTSNPKLLENFIRKTEAFAYQNGAKRVQFDISGKQFEFIKLFENLGYSINGQRPDLNSDLKHNAMVCRYNPENFYHLYKNLKEDLSLTETYHTFEFAWLPLHDGKQQTAAAKAFFSKAMAMQLREFFPDVEPRFMVGVFIRDCNGTVIGGCLGNIYLEPSIPHLYVNAVWLNKSLRGKKLSEMFMGFLEAIAKRAGCIKSHLNTADFQAPWLYKKLGYKEELVQPFFFKDQAGKYYSEYDFYKDL